MKTAIRRISLFLRNFVYTKRTISRYSFPKKINNKEKVLEIEPFTNPSLRVENISYFDVLNKEDLISRAKVENYPIADSNNIPDIHFVSLDGDLSIVKEKFNAVYSSHCIKPQTNLIKHLVDVSDILKINGRYYLVIPDKRYCFDALLPQTNIAFIIEAHREKKNRHSLANVIQHAALTTHNSLVKHWLGIKRAIDNIPDKVMSVLKMYDKVNGGYFDVHSWRFTPDLFSEIVS